MSFSLGSVTLTQSLAGFQHLFVLIIAVFLPENFRVFWRRSICSGWWSKSVAVILIFAGLFYHCVFSRRPADLAPE